MWYYCCMPTFQCSWWCQLLLISCLLYSPLFFSTVTASTNFVCQTMILVNSFSQLWCWPLMKAQRDSGSYSTEQMLACTFSLLFCFSMSEFWYTTGIIRMLWFALWIMVEFSMKLGIERESKGLLSKHAYFRTQIHNILPCMIHVCDP